MNRLANSSSPYLLQHADNPVDWWPWGDEAFDEARDRDVPVFLSVGYSSCHWCHVMAHESFEDDEIAAQLNEHFVSIKVDREERPDVDAIYMEATTALTGHGGWPMSVFLDHERRPFHAGTYWPRRSRGGMPGFPDVLDAVTEAWEGHREDVLESAGNIAEAVSRRMAAAPVAEAVDPATTAEAADLLVTRAWDRSLGGFGRAPKFPQAMTMEFLLDHHLRTGHPEALESVVHTLDRMARGGIHDQLAGGFARYSVDAKWLVPHFEKMAYDNALLLATYAKAAAITGRADLRRVATSIATYLLRDLRHEAGGFFSATDADSEGVEGKYFVWTDEEFRAVLADA
ncbi:MAG: thioredoxin domain-containing protein, partial [Nitriliruptorales bacterium]|nr:thioredoxin domain-containing protein [Nitriliruptorales bacterium]